MEPSSDPSGHCEGASTALQEIDVSRVLCVHIERLESRTADGASQRRTRHSVVSAAGAAGLALYLLLVNFHIIAQEA